MYQQKIQNFNSFFQVKEVQEIVSFENWYWMIICGNEVAFITETAEKSFLKKLLICGMEVVDQAETNGDILF
ncbi:hypothetical protein NV63_10830 [Elizabethkingia anophelis]|nr:hypothetical protein NV63_10830 [Elizabethkingia anophelis]